MQASTTSDGYICYGTTTTTTTTKPTTAATTTTKDEQHHSDIPECQEYKQKPVAGGIRVHTACTEDFY